MAYYALSFAPSAHPHVSHISYLHIQDVNNSTGAHFLTSDRSLSGDDFKARITGLVTEVKDINTDLKDIKTEVKKMTHVFQTIQKEMALQTWQKKAVIIHVFGFFIGVCLGKVLIFMLLPGMTLAKNSNSVTAKE
jgi:hypothetical protein